MEYYQATQNRTAQTVAVVNAHLPGFRLGRFTAADLLTQSRALDALAQTRDDALAAFDAAVNAEQQGFLLVRLLVLALPQAVEGELDDTVEAEADLKDLLDAAYAIVPRTTELALARGKKLVSALHAINAYLAALPASPTPRGPITSGGRGVAELVAALAAQPALEQAVEDRATAVDTARAALRNAATALDRLNKRAYAKLRGEARTNPTLANALGQIVTMSDNLPGTLGLRGIRQGGAEQRHVLVAYDPGSVEAGVTATLEWRVEGVDAEDFFRTVPVDPSGNALGPFAVGQTVRVRTRTRDANGTTTGSVRTLTILPPVV